MNKEKYYYKRLDILRIISCVLVLLYHVNLVKGGFLAVCTFFALSGYLSMISLLKSKNFSIKKYYISRIKKIYLPLLVVILGTVIIAKSNASIKWINLKPETMSAIFCYNNFWQLGASLDYFTRHVSSPFMHLWYISILVQFELLFPIIGIIVKRINNKNNILSFILVIILTSLSLGYFIYLSKTQAQMIVYYDSFARSFSILFGVLMALAHHNFNLCLASKFNKYNSAIYYLYIVALVGICLLVSANSNFYAFYMILATFISLRLIEYAVTSKCKNKKNKVLDFVSKSTYEIYLVQYPIIFFMKSIESNVIAKVGLIIFITLITGFFLHYLLNNMNKNKVVLALSMIILFSVILYGGYLVAMEVDHTEEMKELEAKLNEDLKEIDARNKAFLNDINETEEEWQKVLQSLDDDESKIADIVTNIPVVGIGDSVLLAASSGLYERFPNGYFDGKVSRTIVDGRKLLLELIDEGKVGDTVILALANNGDYITKRNQAMMEALGDRQVYWVNAVKADVPEFNELFKEFAKDYPNLHIVDWEEASKDHPEYFYADGIHVKGAGIKAYATTVYDAIYNTYLSEFNEKKLAKQKEYEDAINEKKELIRENEELKSKINTEIQDLKP